MYTKDSSKITDVEYINGFSLQTRAVSGIEKVIQKVIKVLLTSPGSDAFNPVLGGGLNSYIGRNFATSGELSAEVSSAIRVSEEQIIKSESRKDLPDEEKLGAITILEVQPINRIGVAIKLQITNRLGETGKTSVTL